MPQQVTVGRLVEDVLGFMNYTYWSMFRRAPREKDPDEMLRETAQKLWYIKHLIKAHERILPLGDYARLTAKQRRHRLDLVGEQAREPPYPDKNARRARISVLLKAVAELRSEALVVIDQARLPNDGVFPPDEPTPIAPVEMAGGMIGSLFSKWPALWLLGPHPMASFSFTIGLPLFSAFGPRTRARIPRSMIVVGDDGLVIDIPDDPPPVSTFFGGLDAVRPKKKARKNKEQMVTVQKLKQLLSDVGRELPSAGTRRLK